MFGKSKPCPLCRQVAHPVNSKRESMEHNAMHWAGHTIRHNRGLALMVLAGVGISKLLPRKYRCLACDHSFTG